MVNAPPDGYPESPAAATRNYLASGGLQAPRAGALRSPSQKKRGQPVTADPFSGNVINVSRDF